MTAKIRFIFRLLCIAGCLLYGMAEMFFLFPFYSSKRKLRAIQLWSLRVLASCGMKLQTFGTPPQEGRGQMLISNHISWLDIMAVNGAFPGRFVAKDDVAKWPVVGYLATQAQTVYVSRNRSIKGNSAKIAGVTEALKNGDTVTIFPEGTSTEGREILPFKPSFFQTAYDDRRTDYSGTLPLSESGRHQPQSAHRLLRRHQPLAIHLHGHQPAFQHGRAAFP